MTQLVANLADAALPFVGKPFRMGGRKPDSGLDCIGVIVAALECAGRPVSALPGYSLRQYDLHSLVLLAERVGLHRVAGETIRGDVLHLQPSPSQAHLAISLGDQGIIHAHAGLRRVVISPPPAPWPILRRWRLV